MEQTRRGREKRGCASKGGECSVSEINKAVCNGRESSGNRKRIALKAREIVGRSSVNRWKTAEIIGRLSVYFRKNVGKASGICQEFVGNLSGICREIVVKSSGICGRIVEEQANIRRKSTENPPQEGMHSFCKSYIRKHDHKCK